MICPLELLNVCHLKTTFDTSQGPLIAVNDMSLKLSRGKCLGIVGESGCGKSALALSLLRLHPKQNTLVTGEIFFEGEDINLLSDTDFRNIRGKKISMVFQDPMSSLNPVYTIGQQVESVIRLHFPELTSKEVQQRTVDLFQKVGITAAQERMHSYPHQLSGGTRQRVMLAMAISCQPKLLIADEPTTSLDVTIQSQVLNLIRELQRNEDLAVLLITHDLAVISEMCDDVVVMYAGKPVEFASVVQLFEDPRHPYTRGLLDSIPQTKSDGTPIRLKPIKGSVPDLKNLPGGCSFSDRCPFAQEVCFKESPALTQDSIHPDRSFACHFPLRNEVHHE